MESSTSVSASKCSNFNVFELKKLNKSEEKDLTAFMKRSCIEGDGNQNLKALKGINCSASILFEQREIIIEHLQKFGTLGGLQLKLIAVSLHKAFEITEITAINSLNVTNHIKDVEIEIKLFSKIPNDVPFQIGFGSTNPITSNKEERKVEKKGIFNRLKSNHESVTVLKAKVPVGEELGDPHYAVVALQDTFSECPEMNTGEIKESFFYKIERTTKNFILSVKILILNHGFVIDNGVATYKDGVRVTYNGVHVVQDNSIWFQYNYPLKNEKNL